MQLHHSTFLNRGPFSGLPLPLLQSCSVFLFFWSNFWHSYFSQILVLCSLEFCLTNSLPPFSSEYPFIPLSWYGCPQRAYFSCSYPKARPLIPTPHVLQDWELSPEPSYLQQPDHHSTPFHKQTQLLSPWYTGPSSALSLLPSQALLFIYWNLQDIHQGQPPPSWSQTCWVLWFSNFQITYLFNFLSSPETSLSPKRLFYNYTTLHSPSFLNYTSSSLTGIQFSESSNLSTPPCTICILYSMSHHLHYSFADMLSWVFIEPIQLALWFPETHAL